MFCRHCGKQLNESDKFCPNCGKAINEIIVKEKHEEVVNNKKEVKVDKGPWKSFAVVGFVLGIISLSLCYVLGFGFVFGVPGIIFAALGKKSLNKKKKATVGLTLSIISVALTFIFMSEHGSALYNLIEDIIHIISGGII